VALTKPPKTDNIDFDAWLQELSFDFYNYVRILDVPVSKSGIIGNWTHGNHPSKLMVAGDSGFFGFVVPNYIQEVKEVTVRFIPTTTGTIDYTVNLAYGGVGDDESDSTATLSDTGVAITDDKITEIDITSLFNEIDADDQVGVELVVDALAATTNIEVLTLYFKYI